MADYDIKKLAYGNNNYTIVDSAAQAVLKAIINTGPKNLLPGSLQYGCSKYGEGVCEYVDIPVRVVSGRYVLYAWDFSAWGGTMECGCVTLYYEDGTTSDTVYLEYGQDTTATIVIPTGVVTRIRIYANSTAAKSIDCGMRIQHAMLVHESLWDFDPTFAEYRRNLAEMEHDLDRDTAIINTRVDSTGIKNYAAFTRQDGVYGPYYKTTFTVSNGVVTCSCDSANTGYKAFRVIGDPDNTGWAYGVPLPRGKYILTGLASGSTSSTFRYILGVTQSESDARTSTSIYGDYEFEITTDTARIDLSYYVAQGNAVTASARPMICRIEDYEVSRAYVAPSKTMAELTAKIANLIDRGDKNQIDMSWRSTETIKGVQWVANSDGSITGTRVASDTTHSTCYILLGGSTANVVFDEKMVLSGCPQDGSDSKYRLEAYYTSESGNTFYRDYGNGNGIVIPAGNIRYIACVMNKNQTGSVTFKPMLCSEDDWKWSKKFVPHKG